jgi:hypothetical protein
VNKQLLKNKLLMLNLQNTLLLLNAKSSRRDKKVQRMRGELQFEVLTRLCKQRFLIMKISLKETVRLKLLHRANLQKSSEDLLRERERWPSRTSQVSLRKRKQQ